MPNRMCHQHTLLYTTSALNSRPDDPEPRTDTEASGKGRKRGKKRKDSTKPSVLPPNASVMAMLSMPPPMSLLRWNRRGVKTLYKIIIVGTATL